jgi:hypothetical protein
MVSEQKTLNFGCDTLWPLMSNLPAVWCCQWLHAGECTLACVSADLAMSGVP